VKREVTMPMVKVTEKPLIGPEPIAKRITAAIKVVT
jgi:hypothetical protein